MFTYIFKQKFIMNFNIQQIIYFCLINYVVAFPIFDELWQTNQSESQTNNNPIESQPKIKVEPHEEQFDGRWQDESALKGIVKVEHEPHFGAVKVEGKDKMKHEFERWEDKSGEFKELLINRVKEEVQDGQAPNTSDHEKIVNDDDYWSEDGNKSASSADDFDHKNSNKHLSDQSSSTDQNESVDEQQNESNKGEKIVSDQQKREIIQKFREIKEEYKKKRKYSNNERSQIESKISNGLGVGRSTIYKWIKELGLRKETKSKFSDQQKGEILTQFDAIKSKCMKAKFKNSSKNELDDKIAKKLGITARTIYEWKRKFGLSVSNKKFSEIEKRQILKQFDAIKSKCKKAKLKISMNEIDEKIAKKFGVCRASITLWKRKFGLSSKNKISDATKIEILKKYAKIKRKNPKMSNCDIADLLKISTRSLKRWKVQFREENEYLGAKL